MIVVDCSIIMAGTLQDEANALAEEILHRLETNSLQAIVPSIFYLEASNVLLTAYRKKRINKSVWEKYLDVLSWLPLEIDDTATIPASVLTLSKLANEYNLTTYDAAYLDLAKRQNLTLVTLDKNLHKAATKAGIAYNP